MSGETGVTIAATYVAANKFSVAGNRVDEFYKGLRCRCDLGAAGAVTVTATASAYTGGVTVVTVREYTLAETLTAVGHTPGLPAGSLPAHADEHAVGGYDTLSHTRLADVGEKTHAEIDAYLADVSDALSGEVAARQALASAFEEHAARHAADGEDPLLATDAEAEAGTSTTKAVTPKQVADRAAQLVSLAREILTGPGLTGGGDLSENRTISLVVAVLSELVTYGTPLSGKVVTDTVLAAACKLLISTNTTIHVATTGSDTTGDGSASKPFASIAKALSSIAGKLIASGATVTIQVADGTYAIASTITIDHPDADKIQILGNTTAETVVAIAAIDTTAKTITVAGDYTASIQAGDIIGLTGSSTSGLNGAYVVSDVIYSGGNTVLTCSAETVASAAVGGGGVYIQPCNRVRLVFSSSIPGLYIKKPLYALHGFRIDGPGSSIAILCDSPIRPDSISKIIVQSFDVGIYVSNGVVIYYLNFCAKACSKMFYSSGGRLFSGAGVVICDTADFAMLADSAGYINATGGTRYFRSIAVASYSPDNTVGNSNAYITR